jgi:Phage tail tube protein
MAQGADVVIGHARGAVWNTAVSVNAANRGLLVNNWTIGNGLGPLIYSESLTGSGGRANALRGLNKLTGDVASELRYTGLEHVLAMILGTGGVPTLVETTAQRHVLNLANNVDGLYDTVVVQKVGPTAAPALPLWEYPSVKWAGFTMTLPADGLATLTLNAIASSCKPLTGQVNTSLAAVTYRTKTHNAFGTHIKFRANASSGIALADADRFYPSSITFTFNRNMDSAFVEDGTGVQPEPYYTTFFDATLTIAFPVYGVANLQANNTFLQNAFNEVPMKLDITLTSPQLAGATAPYSILIEAPFVVIGNVQMPVNDAGVIPQDVEMAMLAATAAPTGMTGLTQHFRITIVSQLASDPLLNP